jgi:hypothetical protein
MSLGETMPAALARLGLVVLALAPAACTRAASRREVSPQEYATARLARGYLDEIRSRMRDGQPTAVKCAGARAIAEELPQTDALRAELAKTCAYDAPLASAKAALARAEVSRSAGRTAAPDCAETKLCLEDLAKGSPDGPEIADVTARYRKTCE